MWLTESEQGDDECLELLDTIYNDEYAQEVLSIIEEELSEIDDTVDE